MRLDHFGMYPEQAFQPIGKRMTLEGGGKGSAPPPPDYAGAARETAAGNKEAAISAQAGNMVNQYTPQGKVEYAVRGYQDGTPLCSQTVTQSPEQQDFIQTVEEFRTEEFADFIHDFATDFFDVLAFFLIGQIFGPQIGGHDQDGVGKIDCPSLSIGETPIIQNL